MKAHNDSKSEEGINCHITGYCGHPGIVGFIKNYSNAFSIFYCLDIPVGTYNFLKGDAILMVILKYHIQIKMLITAKMALDLTRK